MKKFASLKVFRNVLFILLAACSANDVLCQNIPAAFQTSLKKCWEISPSLTNDIASDNEFLILSNENGEISRIEKDSGKEIWKTSIGEKTDSIVGFQNGDIMLVSAENNVISGSSLLARKLDPQTGIVKELKKIGKLDERIGFENLKQLAFSQKSLEVDNLLKIVGQTESLTKNTDKEAFIQVSLYNRTSFVMTDGRVIERVSFEDGNKRQLYKVKIDDQKISLIAGVNDSIVWGDESGKFFQKRSETDIPTKLLRTGGRVSSIQNAGNNLLITSNDNFLYFYSLTKKKILWKKRLSGRIVIPPKLEDGFVAVTTNAVPELIFIDLETGKSFNQIILPEDSYIKDFRIDSDSIYILTYGGLIKFSGICR